MRRDCSTLAIFLSVLALLISGIAFAQETTNYASIGGRITDPSGAAIADVRVTAREVATNITSSATTDREGRFRFPYLKIGQYELDVSQPGFQ